MPANVRLTGLRGVGKSVLLKRLEEIASDEEDWLTSRIQAEPRHNTENDLSELILGLCHNAELQVSRAARIRETMKGVTASARGLVHVTWQDIEVSLGRGGGADRHRSLAKALFDVALVADHHGYSGYLVMLDEAQVIRDDRDREGQHPLSLLIAAVNSLQEKEVPIGLTLCGLPTLRANLLKARTYTERMFRGEEITRLARSEAVDALVRPLDGTGVTADERLIERVIEEVEGYPFFIQLWGAELWEAAQLAGGPVPIVDSASATAEEVAAFLLERGQNATRSERGSLELLVTDLPKTFSDVAERFLGEPVAQVEQVDL